jgi:hypothetical protein
MFKVIGGDEDRHRRWKEIGWGYSGDKLWKASVWTVG